MERKVIIVCCVVGFLGLLSAATGFAAEATKIKADQIQSPSPTVCIYPRSPALNLGLTAAFSLMIAQIIISFATGCNCCRKGPHQSNSNRTLALICSDVSLFTFAIASLLLQTGAILNYRHGACYVVRPGVFAGASILSLCSVIFALIDIILTEKNRIDPSASVHPTQGGSVAMGHLHASDPCHLI